MYIEHEGTFNCPRWICKKANKNSRSKYMIQSILKINIQLKPEYFLLELMDKQLEKGHGILFQYMITTVRLLYAWRWKDLTLTTMEQWLVTNFAEMDKLSSVIREKIFTLIANWKPLMNFWSKNEKNGLVT